MTLTSRWGHAISLIRKDYTTIDATMPNMLNLRNIRLNSYNPKPQLKPVSKRMFFHTPSHLPQTSLTTELQTLYSTNP
jgi:hypothetical protein